MVFFNAAIVTSAGLGTRMGVPTPKQYMELAGRPILAWAIRAFQEHPLIHQIVVTVPKGHRTRCLKEIVEQFHFSKVTEVVEGGETRQASVFNGLTKTASSRIVSIHDGARPFVSAKTISETIELASQIGSAIAAEPVTETVKRCKGQTIETLPRSDLWLAHTPQTFRTQLILEAHRKALEEGVVATDDSMLVERLGYPVGVVLDSPDNIKITTTRDLDFSRLLAETLLKHSL
jgi:2-C-methyl-D-erythritol 4-phosphate cytidylyltransferase